MKILGLIGGCDRHTADIYWRAASSSPCLMCSIGFDEAAAYGSARHWERLGGMIHDAAKRLLSAGAGALVLCGSEEHIALDHIEKDGLPLLHIADSVACELCERGIRSAAVLGAKLPAEFDFYARAFSRLGIASVIPEKNAGCEERSALLEEIWRLSRRGAEAVVLTCGKVPIGHDDSAAPVFSAPAIHATRAAAEFGRAHML